jgi:L-ascorbate metabolism protein UlaG (beta-lactamase superfamily)
MRTGCGALLLAGVVTGFLASEAMSADTGDLQVIYYGHSCFEINHAGKRLVIDPFTPEWFDYKLPEGHIDYGFVSHLARDHATIEGLAIERVFFASGNANEFEVVQENNKKTLTGKITEHTGDGQFAFWTVPSFHDDVQGAHNGVNGILCFDFDGVKIVHLGDIGQKRLEQEQLASIGTVDVLMVPVDSYYVIELEAAREIVNQLSPTIVIPIHFRTDKSVRSKAHKDDLLRFSQMFSDVKHLQSSVLPIDKQVLDVSPHLLLMDHAPPDHPGAIGPYLGLDPPGAMPEAFAPGITSGVFNHGNPSFTRDENEFYFFRWEGGEAEFLVMKREDGRWTDPATVPFSKEHKFEKANVSPDGQNLFFCSRKSPGKGGEPGDLNLWVMKRQGGTWAGPEPLGPAVNSDHHEAFPFVAGNGDLYFFRDDPDEAGCEILVSRFANATYLEPENLGGLVNSDKHEVDPCIAPDDSYLVFCVRDREGGFGNNDLYVSFRNENGSWSQSVNLGPAINSPFEELTPHVTPDGKLLFFSSDRNGRYEIFWVNTEAIEALRPRG